MDRYETFPDKVVIPAIFKDVLGLNVRSFTRSSSWGSSHVIYFVKLKGHRDLVFRANTGASSTPEIEMLLEKLITEKVQKIGVPTNKVLHVDISRSTYPFDFQIQEVLAGRDPEADFDGSEENYLKIVYQTGQAIAQLSSIKFEGFGRFDTQSALGGELRGAKDKFSDYIMLNVEDDLAGLAKHQIIDDSRATSISRYIAERKSIINAHRPASLVHHDLADHNLMYRHDTLTGIFDWETAVAGDPILDLASCPTWKSHYPKRDQLLKGYQSITKLPDNFEELEKVYRLRTMLWKGYYAIRANIVNDARRELIEATFQACGL